jgi:integrase
VVQAQTVEENRDVGRAEKAALGQHASRYAAKFGPAQPEFVFPLSNWLSMVDPAEPVTTVKTAWEWVRETTKVEFGLHDLRHSSCTKLAEAGVPESTMLDMMGHVSPTMLRRYSHIRAKARREAIDALEARQVSNVVPKVSPKVSDSANEKSAVTH